MDLQPRLPSGTAFLSPPKMRQPLSSQSQISPIFFFLSYKGEKISVSKTVSSNLFTGTKGFITRKIHPHPTRTHTCPHTPDKALKNYLSRKSVFQAEGQGSFKDAPSFPLVLFTSFSLGLCLGPHCQPGE